MTRADKAQPGVSCKSIHFQALDCVTHLCGRTCFRECNDTVAVTEAQKDAGELAFLMRRRAGTQMAPGWNGSKVARLLDQLAAVRKAGVDLKVTP